MSQFTKRKFTYRELDDLYLPEKGQSIAQILEGRGNRLFKVKDQSGEEYLVSLPSRFSHVGYLKSGEFRCNFIITHISSDGHLGNFVIVEPIIEGKKVRGEVVHVLYDRQVQHIAENSNW